jgi:hypothetical protein
MGETIKAKTVEVSHRSLFGLWIGMLLPPVAWALQLQTLWLTSEYGCATSNFLWNHVAAIIALLLSMIGGLVAFRAWRATGGGTNDDDASHRSRHRFMGMLGMLTGALFTTVIFAQWLPTLTGVPCDK